MVGTYIRVYKIMAVSTETQKSRCIPKRGRMDDTEIYPGEVGCEWVVRYGI